MMTNRTKRQTNSMTTAIRPATIKPVLAQPMKARIVACALFVCKADAPSPCGRGLGPFVPQRRDEGELTRTMTDAVPSAWRGVPLSLDEMHDIIHGMQAYYDERATQYDDWYKHINLYDDPANNAAWHAELEQLTTWVQAFGQGRLLEIASGTGWWTRRLARRAAVTTLDYSPAMIEVLRGRLTAEGQRADVSRGNAYRLP